MTGARRPAGIDRQALARYLLHAQALQQRRFLRWGITPGGWAMLMALYVRTPRRLATKSLCLSSGLPMRTAVRIVDQLVRRGLLTRRIDANDRRQVNLELSRLATGLLDAYFEELVALTARGLAAVEALSD